MPLNTLRLNHQASSHPNERIVFIKPLKRQSSEQASYDLAETFLSAIAAQCLPIMKGHYLSVTTLEEYEPNPEFVGRNFNNGEIIQLVLRSKNGGWLPFNMVQMVMMHELAHNTHMNHGKQFWQTRNIYSQEMRQLWAKGYTGEGFWGSGRMLDDMSSVMGSNSVPSEELQHLPLCGGTYRSRRRKRKAGGDGRELTWKEKRDRRIEKKFGKNGMKLGEDEDRRLMLEIRRKGPIGGAPRVAKSKRGRELRAAAALARFGSNKKEIDELEKQEEDDDEEESDREYEETDYQTEDATDINGERLLDSHGRGMAKVCDDQDQDDANVKQELDELEEFTQPLQQSRLHGATSPPKVPSESATHKSLCDIPAYRESSSPLKEKPKLGTAYPKITIKKLPAATKPSTTNTSKPNTNSSKSPTTCPICSMTNDRLNPTCTACSHVLDPKKDLKNWHCHSEVCQESQYLNSGDVGVCGVCGARKED